MNLYLVTTERCGGYYVIAESFDNAKNSVKEMLDKADYDFSQYREVVNVNLVSKEITNIIEKGGLIINK
jgi:hypothetical protein